ncbi:MAG: RtcB family protein [Candidatus Omnitrophica bacterium]|nr:RtcB family protein [Candidatus Omnitrophota bacterium]MBU1128326.1 RtcB family protein [Candidatus Omnitrophota bacterium]MBU1657305.1 RtcB family protein [Candidatus Omnitrophota bacterium]MBU1784580.1 RtcB family protein [Candidatus Omnitrophota bacterium]MBU1851756.1 RtcB family protein [Candidatus Omnitrophota bacterium]
MANAAHLPGIVRASMAMPDIHWGYGLPIGGVIATDIDSGGVITPGAIGFDINCGVRLIRTDLAEEDVRPRIKELIETLFRDVPTGVGSTGDIRLDSKSGKRILVEGAAWAVKEGYGLPEDIDHCEERGALAGADPSKVSPWAYQRDQAQSGTLGSGNHFLEVQVVDEVFRDDAAKAFGIKKGQVTLMIHTGSRGFGHQICVEYAEKMVRLVKESGIMVPAD